MKAFLALWLTGYFFLMASCTHQTPQRHQAQVPDGETTPLVTDARVEKSFAELEFKDLSVVMLTIMGSVDDHPQACRWSQEQKASLPQMLQAELDARWEQEKQLYVKKKKSRHMFSKNCIQNCSCQAEAAFLDYLQRAEVKLSQREKQVAERVTQDSASAAYIQSCSPQPWVCQSQPVRAAIKSLEE